MKTTLFLAVFAALPLFAQQEAPVAQPVPAPATCEAKGEMPKRPSREGFHKKMLEKYDADKDGQLSDTEKEAMKAEMKKRHQGKRPGMGGNKGPRGPQGQRPEGRPSREDFQKKVLEKYDADKDGQLSDTEKEAMKAEMKKRHQGKRPGMGGNKGPRGPQGQRPEGRPSREDFQKKMLEKFDADKDGQLSDAEKEAMKASRPGRGKGKGKGRGSKGPRGAKNGANVPVTLPL